MHKHAGIITANGSSTTSMEHLANIAFMGTLICHGRGKVRFFLDHKFIVEVIIGDCDWHRNEFEIWRNFPAHADRGITKNTFTEQ